MKTKLTILGSLASLGAAASLNAQAVTAAVGYHTEYLIEGFNVLAVNVGNPVAAAGEFDDDAATDNDVDFTALLTAGVPYTVQNINTGETARVDAIVDANNLDTTLGVTNGDRYEIRKDQTINDVFGAANEAGLLEGDRLEADIIWLPDGNGGYTRYYRNNVEDPNFLDPKTPGWRELADGTTDVGDTVIPFTFGFFLQVREMLEEPKRLVFVGHVRGEDDVDDGHGARTTVVDLANGFNVLSRIAPVGLTLGEVGGAAGSGDLLNPGDRGDADILWNPDGNGGYIRYYDNNVEDPNFLDPKTPGWRELADGTTDQAGVNIKSGYLVQRRADAGSISVSMPARLDL